MVATNVIQNSINQAISQGENPSEVFDLLYAEYKACPRSKDEFALILMNTLCVMWAVNRDLQRRIQRSNYR